MFIFGNKCNSSIILYTFITAYICINLYFLTSSYDRITKIDELVNAGSKLLSGFQQALGSFTEFFLSYASMK